MSENSLVLRSDKSSGVLQIINSGLGLVYLVLSVIFSAIYANKLLVVMNSITFGLVIIYTILSSIASFCGNLRAINVMLRIERGFYATVIGLMTSTTVLNYTLDSIGWAITGVLWASSLAGIIYGGLTKRGAEKYYQIFIVFSCIVASFFAVKSQILSGYLFLFVFILMIISSIIFAVKTPKWKRVVGFTINTFAFFIYFTSIMILILS